MCQIELALAEGANLVSGQLPNASRLAPDLFQLAVTDMFLVILDALRKSQTPFPVRMWVVVPGIHVSMTDSMDRYQVFNAGRYDAFCEWFGGPEMFAKALPAASAVGHRGDHFQVHALGSVAPGIPVENPRQIPAFGYSRKFGPRPPCFARATVAQLPFGTRLLVAGTASILGENTAHQGSLARQFEETMENLAGLAESVPGTDRYHFDNVETARVFSPVASELNWLGEKTQRRFPNASVECVCAELCRSDLMVEIEATIAPSPE